MKDISNLFEKYLAAYRKGCNHFQGGSCSRREGCDCVAPAEVWAFTEHLVPRSCFSKHLDSFVGVVPGEEDGQVLSPAVVAEAKRVLVEYCWGNVKYDASTDFQSPQMLQRSVLDRRRNDGTSLIIHGNSQRGMTTKSPKGIPLPQVQKKSVGRTLLASIVMKEVIRRRSFPGHVADSYEWVSFPALKSRVTDRDHSAITDYQTADWLVVDGIHPLERVSDNMRGYQLEKLNAVFVDRIENRLPTILVFQFDITADLRAGTLHEKVGLGMSQIVEDDTTFKINLSLPASLIRIVDGGNK